MSEWIANYAALWTVATVLLGFHIAALAWRMRREPDIQAGDETTWLTVADWMVIPSLMFPNVPGGRRLYPSHSYIR